MTPYMKKILPFFNVAIISVILETKTCKVFVKIIKNSKLIKTEEKKFDVNEGELSREVINYINSYQDNYKFTYIGTLLGSINQGAISGCNQSDFKKFGVVADGVNSICVDKKWATYGFNDDIVSTQNRFNKTIGIDFIYSPFIVLYHFFKKEFTKEAKLYVLCQKSYVAIGVFKEGRFIFGAYFSIDTNEDTFKTESSAQTTSPSTSKGSETIQNHDDEEELDELVFFEDDEDVISLDDGEAESEIDEEREIDEDGNVGSIEAFNEGLDLHNYIKNSIEEFYKNDKYETEFLSDIVIADNCNLTDDVIKYIQDELMLHIDVKEINVAKITANIIEEEVLG